MPANTVLAVAYDLKVFFAAVGKPPRRVRPADVLGFMTAQRAGESFSVQETFVLRKRVGPTPETEDAVMAWQ